MKYQKIKVSFLKKIKRINFQNMKVKMYGHKFTKLKLN